MAAAGIVSSLLIALLLATATGLHDDHEEEAELVAAVDASSTEDAEDDANLALNASGPSCNDFCVQCQDGSSVWYGRSKNWFKMGATTVLAGVTAVAAGPPGLVAFATGGAISVGATGTASVAAGTAAGMATGMGEGISNGQETHTHWSANIPTTGFSCEKVDVLKFSKEGGKCVTNYLMQGSQKWFGRKMNNQLKPYDADDNNLEGFGIGDRFAYKEACKILHAAGATGSWKQFASNFYWYYCNMPVTKAANQCSAHSKLCGAKGVVGVTNAKTADQCHMQCQDDGTFQGDVKCPATTTTSTTTLA